MKRRSCQQNQNQHPDGLECPPRCSLCWHCVFFLFTKISFAAVANVCARISRAGLSPRPSPNSVGTAAPLERNCTMNPFYFEIEAGKTCKSWIEHHHKGCTLIIWGDIVLAVPHEQGPLNHPKCLKLTPRDCRRGLSARRWSKIGKALFELYYRLNP